MLLAVLLRTRACDHASLRLVCKRIRNVIDSVQFRRERSEQGFAEVEIGLLSPFEQYKQNNSGGYPLSENDTEFYVTYDDFGHIGQHNDYSFETRCFRAFVDKVPIHKVRQGEDNGFALHVRVLPLRAPFWEICYSFNQTICDLGSTLLTNKGKPKVASLKKAREDDDEMDYMMYIEDFKVPFEYRFPASTVGPLLIKQVLQLLEDVYSLAMYIPYRETQYTKEEAKAEKTEEKDFRLKDSTSDAEIQAQDGREARDDILTEQDMLQFFRAGFYQVNEQSIVQSSNYSFVFATRIDVNKTILSFEAALERPIARKVRARPEAKGLAREFRLLMTKKSIEWNEKLEKISLLLGSPLQNPRFSSLFEEFTSPLQQLGDQESMLSVAIQRSTVTGMEVGGVEAMRDAVRSARVSLEQKIDQACSRLQPSLTEEAADLEAKLETFKIELREEIKAFVDKSGNVVQLFHESDVVHVAVAGNNMDLLEMILEFLPTSKKLRVLNEPERFGFTPLMMVAAMAPTHGLRKARQTMEALINMGANKNITHASQGLSAFGQFRFSLKLAVLSRPLSGYRGLPTKFKEECLRIEALLRPANGPTPADIAMLEADHNSSSDSE